ncbi:MAG: cytochrome C biogenesis protein CcsA, partial [Burkholderiaceae bacterium]
MSLKKTAIGIALAALATVSMAAPAAMNEPIKPIQPAKVTQPALVELGKKLYFEPRLSGSG